jgi:DNA repair protein RadC
VSGRHVSFLTLEYHCISTLRVCQCPPWLGCARIQPITTEIKMKATQRTRNKGVQRDKAESQDRPKSEPGRQKGDDEIIAMALRIIETRMRVPGVKLTSPDLVKEYVSLRIGVQEYESFVVLFLDLRNCLIAGDAMFRGTLTQTSVYPREIVKAALAHNAASVILAHNHPSGSIEPSMTDKVLTNGLKEALALVDVKVLDHIIVSGISTYSFAENGDL